MNTVGLLTALDSSVFKTWATITRMKNNNNKPEGVDDKSNRESVHHLLCWWFTQLCDRGLRISSLHLLLCVIVYWGRFEGNGDGTDAVADTRTLWPEPELLEPVVIKTDCKWNK